MRKGINKTRKKVAKFDKLDHCEKNDYHQKRYDENQEGGDRIQGT
jgi:hypothetical protein